MTLSLPSRRPSSSPFPPSALLYQSGRSAQLTTNYASSQALGSDLDNAMDYSVEVVLLGKMSKLEKTKLSRFLINNWNPNRPEFAHVEMVPLKAHSKSTKIMPTSIKSPVKTVSDYGIVRNSTIGHNSITGQVASSIHTDDDLQKAAHSIRPGTYNLLGLEGENSSTRLHLGEISLQPASISLITLSTTSTGTVEAKVYVLHEARLVHMLYQVPQIMLLTLSEIFVCIPAMTFAYSESPAGMKTTVQAVNLVTIFIGNCLVILAASVPGRQTDRVQEFLLFAGLAIACALVTWLLVRRYRANQQRRAEREEFIRLLHLKAAEEAAASALAASIPEDQGQHKRGKAVQEENEGEQLGHQLVENEHASLLRPSSQAPQIAEVVWKEKSKADPSETGRIGIAEVISVCREEPVKRTFDHKKSSQVSQASGGSPLLLQTQRSFIILGRSEQGHPSRPGRADSLLAEARKFSYTSGLHQSVWPSCQIISPSKKLSHSAGSPCFSGTTSATSAALASGLATVGVVTSNSNRRRSRGTSLSVWSPHIARMEPDAGGALARYDSFYSVGEQSVGWRVGELAYAEPGFGLDIRSLAEKHLCLEQERS
ncbi:unnamed protein product [Protopolystoma xenopodis]|uniref:Uncharacterized protein n=1 Tax=Protopolystoma xenopodis TaxID=117903 RepID=A0A448WF24_9PLAT|nr:unnamed protein product [Protopolystoma xenopodis]